MKYTKLVTTLVAATVIAGAIAAPAYAWHPKGVITKFVQNVTASGQMADANGAASAVAAKPGDTLKYTIVIENKGTVDASGNNDMHYTKLTDTLPDGIELVDTPAVRTLTADIGVLKPGEKATKEYMVKVTSQTDGAVIANTACFTGDSKVKDNAQKGCDDANIKISVPPKTSIPTPPQTLSTSTTLPVTGPGNFVAPAAFVGVLGYALNLLRLKFRREQ